MHVQWNPALQTLINMDTHLLRTVLFVPTTHIFSYINPLNMDTRIIQTLFHVPLVSVLTGFHYLPGCIPCICQGFQNSTPKHNVGHLHTSLHMPVYAKDYNRTPVVRCSLLKPTLKIFSETYIKCTLDYILQILYLFKKSGVC